MYRLINAILCILLTLLIAYLVYDRQDVDIENTIKKLNGGEELKNYTYDFQNGSFVSKYNGKDLIAINPVNIKGEFVSNDNQIKYLETGFQIQGIAKEFICPEGKFNGLHCENIKPMTCLNEPGARKALKNNKYGYIICEDKNNYKISTCPEGHIFSDNSLSCEINHEFCKTRANGYTFANKDQSSYNICQNSIIKIERCKNSLIFDPLKKLCLPDKTKYSFPPNEKLCDDFKYQYYDLQLGIPKCYDKKCWTAFEEGNYIYYWDCKDGKEMLLSEINDEFASFDYSDSYRDNLQIIKKIAYDPDRQEMRVPGNQIVLYFGMILIYLSREGRFALPASATFFNFKGKIYLNNGTSLIYQKDFNRREHQEFIYSDVLPPALNKNIMLEHFEPKTGLGFWYYVKEKDSRNTIYYNYVYKLKRSNDKIYCIYTTRFSIFLSQVELEAEDADFDIRTIKSKIFKDVHLPLKSGIFECYSVFYKNGHWAPLYLTHYQQIVSKEIEILSSIDYNENSFLDAYRIILANFEQIN